MTKQSKKKKKFNLKNLDKQDKTLLGTLVLLIILVAVLAIIALNIKNNEQNKKANIIIPILEKQTQNEISVDLSDMKKGETKEYIFKVSNYKQSDVNKKELQYDIIITSADSAKIKLYKGNSKNNLLEKDLNVEDNTLPKDKKTEDEYHLIIETTKTPGKTDKITLKINS